MASRCEHFLCVGANQASPGWRSLAAGKQGVAKSSAGVMAVCTARVGPLLVVVLFLCLTAEASAGENGLSLRQMLLMPGKLAAGHVEFEADCHKCHASFDKANQTPLCLDCHEEIAADLQSGHRLHGHVGSGGDINCVDCHSDHKGRDADISGLDPDHFGHDTTEFPLLGAHATLNCADCHSSGTRFRDAESGCADCHDDVHRGKLGDDCRGCHTENGWRDEAFDHEGTGFPLNGAHKGTACSSCHVDQRFEGASPECAACHLGKDRHLGAFGRECGTCHESGSWTEMLFDHDRATRFPLSGRHGRLACQDCHRDGLPLQLPTGCVDCHSAEDVHRGTNGEDCASCHETTDWHSVRFDHETDAGFALVGAHKDVACASCHAKGQAAEKPVATRDCVDCHGSADPHDGQLGQDCGRCHGQTKWNLDVVFSHDFSEFPLTGAHQGLPCASCHFTSAFHDAKEACVDCHKGDDPHDAMFGETCTDCHNTAAWLSWSFEHDKATEYPLTGSHTRLACELCHARKLPDPMHPPQRCVACHGADDAHRGGFGSDCGRCHDTEAFGNERR